MPLIKLQKRAVRITTNKKYRDHTIPLFLDCKVLKIVKIYQLKLSKLMFKVYKNILTISDSPTFTSILQSITIIPETARKIFIENKFQNNT